MGLGGDGDGGSLKAQKIFLFAAGGGVWKGFKKSVSEIVHDTKYMTLNATTYKNNGTCMLFMDASRKTSSRQLLRISEMEENKKTFRNGILPQHNKYKDQDM